METGWRRGKVFFYLPLRYPVCVLVRGLTFGLESELEGRQCGWMLAADREQWDIRYAEPGTAGAKRIGKALLYLGILGASRSQSEAGRSDQISPIV